MTPAENVTPVPMTMSARGASRWDIAECAGCACLAALLLLLANTVATTICSPTKWVGLASMSLTAWAMSVQSLRAAIRVARAELAKEAARV